MREKSVSESTAVADTNDEQYGTRRTGDAALAAPCQCARRMGLRGFLLWFLSALFRSHLLGDLQDLRVKGRVAGREHVAGA